jgi:hypothetical protein
MRIIYPLVKLIDIDQSIDTSLIETGQPDPARVGVLTPHTTFLFIFMRYRIERDMFRLIAR